MVVQNIDALTQFTNENAENWNENSIVLENLLVYDTVNRIFKKGNGSDTFNNLPVWLDINELENIYNQAVIVDLNIFTDDMIDHMVIIDKDEKITTSPLLTLTDLTNLYNLINQIDENAYSEAIRVSNIISIVSLNYSDKGVIGTDITLSADSINSCDLLDSDLEYKWYLNNTLYNDNAKVITYNIPNDNNLIGSTLTFKCIVYSPLLDISSMFKEATIEIIDNVNYVKPVLLNTDINNIF